MTNDLWNELVAQVEDHGPGAITFTLVDHVNSEYTDLVVNDVSWEDNEIVVAMEVNVV